jgi:uncharacterized membrane protein YkvA (DUF1232 family)
MQQWIQQQKKLVAQLKKKLFILYLALKHPKTPWYAKVMGMLVLGYALSPIDLIPDFIPVLGYLDDLILLPLGIIFAMKLIPTEVWDMCAKDVEKSAGDSDRVVSKKIGYLGAFIVGTLWLMLAIILYIKFFG